MIRITLGFVLACVLSFNCLAETHIDRGGTQEHEYNSHTTFDLDEETELKLTVACKIAGRNTGHVRVWFYSQTRDGRWREITDLRVMLRSDTPEQSGTFKLPAGEYRVRISVRYVEYLVRLEDAED